MMSQEEKARLLTEARMIQAASPVLHPLLEQRKTHAFQRLMAAYRDGHHDQNAVAELFLIDSIQNELKSKIQNLTLAEEK